MTVEPGTPAEYVTWFVALTGLWIAASAFLYDASAAAFNNNIAAGLIVAVAAAFVGLRIRQG